MSIFDCNRSSVALCSARISILWDKKSFQNVPEMAVLLSKKKKEKEVGTGRQYRGKKKDLRVQSGQDSHMEYRNILLVYTEKKHLIIIRIWSPSAFQGSLATVKTKILYYIIINHMRFFFNRLFRWELINRTSPMDLKTTKEINISSWGISWICHYSSGISWATFKPVSFSCSTRHSNLSRSV